MSLLSKDLVTIRQLGNKEIELILDCAASLKEVSTREIKKVPALRGKTIVNLFLEPSTRTRVSFEIAAKRLSADTINVSGTGTSISKGETLADTARNIQAMNPDILVIRHPAAGAPLLLSKILTCSVINAGDGAHEHPTQALLDMFTIREKKGRIAGLKIAIIGDISHSRVARSNIWGLRTMGAEVTVAGPPTMIPVDAESLGVKVSYDLIDAIKDADVIMMLRIQRERMAESLFPSLREYSRYFGLGYRHLKQARPEVIIMHPGPVNRGVELESALADSDHAVILDQVTNGVAVRMALLYLLAGGIIETGN
ncbi:MAG: aspartate carbamoyltransferase catalytic subunit [Thermodesulfobacteriota bacterium]